MLLMTLLIHANNPAGLLLCRFKTSPLTENNSAAETSVKFLLNLRVRILQKIAKALKTIPDQRPGAAPNEVPVIYLTIAYTSL